MLDKNLISNFLKNLQETKDQINEKIKIIQQREFFPQENSDLFNIVINGKFEVVSCSIDPSLLSDASKLEKIISNNLNNVLFQISEELKNLQKSSLGGSFV